MTESPGLARLSSWNRQHVAYREATGNSGVGAACLFANQAWELGTGCPHIPLLLTVLSPDPLGCALHALPWEELEATIPISGIETHVNADYTFASTDTGDV